MSKRPRATSTVPAAAAAAAAAASYAMQIDNAAGTPTTIVAAASSSTSTAGDPTTPEPKRSKRSHKPTETFKPEEPKSTTKRAKKAVSTPKVSSKKKQSKQRRSAEDDADEEMEDAAAPTSAVAAPPRFKENSIRCPPIAFHCDSGSLSIVFSFLGSLDFFSAVAVSRQWHSTGSLHTAWPKQSIAELIRSLQENRYNSDTAVRRLTIRPRSSPSWASNNDPVGKHIDQLLKSRIFSKVNDIQFAVQAKNRYWYGTSAAQATAVRTGLLQVAEFPYLTALNIIAEPEHFWMQPPGYGTHGRIDADYIKQLFGVLAPKLQAITLSTDASHQGLTTLFHNFLHLLPQLRSLVLDGAVSSTVLSQLPLLEFLHFRTGAQPDPAFWSQVCQSSSGAKGRLRGVSVMVAGGFSAQYFRPPITALYYNDGTAAADCRSELTMLAINGVNFEQSGFEALLLGVPTLTHLEVDLIDAFSIAKLVLPLLRTLRIRLHRDSPSSTLTGSISLDALSLPQMPNLEVFSLMCREMSHVAYTHDITHTKLRELFTRMPLLTNLRIGSWQPRNDQHAIAAAAVAADPPFSELLLLPHLRSLDLTILPQPSLSLLLPIIAQLDQIRTVELTCFPVEVHATSSKVDGMNEVAFELPSSLYHTIAQSPHWHTLRVHVSNHAKRGGRQCNLITNTWSPATKYSGIPTLSELLRPITPKSLHSTVERRVREFRLYRHSDEKESFKCFQLDQAGTRIGQLGWKWRKEGE